MKQPAVYLLASQRNGTLYIGVTSDLIKRVWQHRTHAAEGFTKKYSVDRLVWFEQHESMESAIAREKALKKWNRAWKLSLIEASNPQWIDLWPEIIGENTSPPRHSSASPHSSVPHHSSVPCHSRESGNPETGQPGSPADLCHSREGGNPETTVTEPTAELDSRFRGNDGTGGSA